MCDRNILLGGMVYIVNHLHVADNMLPYMLPASMTCHTVHLAAMDVAVPGKLLLHQ